MKKYMIALLLIVGILEGVAIFIIYEKIFPEPEYTHIIIENADLNIWSHVPLGVLTYEDKPLVRFYGYGTISIYQKSEITLEDTVTILVSDVIQVNGQIIPHDVRDVYITIDGNVEENTLIRPY